MKKKSTSKISPLTDLDLNMVSGGFESDEIYERYDGFKMTKKIMIDHTSPLPCPSCQTEKTMILDGSKDSRPAWICNACGTMHYY